MSTASIAGLTKQLVALVTSVAGSSGVYVDRPPDGSVYPYVIARVVGLRHDPNFDLIRLTGTFECTVMARPRAQAQAAEALADAVMLSLVTYKSALSGVTFTTGVQRDTMPTFASPADADVVQIRVAVSFACWPQLLVGP